MLTAATMANDRHCDNGDGLMTQTVIQCILLLESFQNDKSLNFRSRLFSLTTETATKTMHLADYHLAQTDRTNRS